MYGYDKVFCVLAEEFIDGNKIIIYLLGSSDRSEKKNQALHSSSIFIREKEKPILLHLGKGFDLYLKKNKLSLFILLFY